MSLPIKIIGIVIIIIGALTAMSTLYTSGLEVSELSLTEALAPERFMSYMIKYIGQALIVGFGFVVYVIGIKLEHRSSS
jgi:hypothetical protein